MPTVLAIGFDGGYEPFATTNDLASNDALQYMRGGGGGG